MAGHSPPTTSFDDIELHKENIQPLASGRSARALAQVLSSRASPVTLRGENAIKQAAFEAELKTASDLDDPLEVWVRYVNWAVETFPSGSSHESGLVHLLERVTREFVHEEQYKNDPRYLKLWIQYIQNFHDTPREAFAYVARHDIGQKLALFYEEFATLLESIGRKNQAAEVYQTGIENNARPVDRLVRKFAEFQQRLELSPAAPDEPSSPALRVARPALAAKPLEGGLGLTPDPLQQQQPAAAAKKPARQKMAIFSDADAGPTPKPTAPGGWEELGTREQRKKENTVASKPFAGQVLKQEGGKKSSSEGGKLMVFRDTSLQPQYNQEIQNKFIPSQTTLVPGKRMERVAVNIELVYPSDGDGEEYSFEEVRAIGRGLYGIDWAARREDEAEESARRRRNDRSREQVFEEKRAPITVKTVMSPEANKGKIRRKMGANTMNAEPTMTFHTRAATDEIYDIFNQPLQLKSEGGEESESEGEEFDGEDYTMATQVGGQLEQQEDGDDDDDAGSVKSEWSDFTLRQNAPEEGEQGEQGEQGEEVGEDELVKNKFDKLAIHKDEKLSVFKDEGLDESKKGPPSRIPVNRIVIPSPPEDFDPPRMPYHTGQAQSQSRLPYMTPIVEKTESLPPTTIRRKEHAKTPSRSRMPDIMDDGPAIPSPFGEIGNDSALAKPLVPSRPDPPLVPKERERKPFGAKPVTAVKPVAKPKEEPIIQDLQCNPMDEALRAQIYEKLQPPLKSYEGFYQNPGKFGKAGDIRKFSKAVAKGGEVAGPMIDFVTGEGGSSYTIRREIGKGAFAPVYLAENNTVADAEDEMEELEEDEVEARAELAKKITGRKRFEAVKMEHPPSPWEFYIMRQSIRRLGVSRASESILPVHEMHLFPDEGYLILSYRDQGTILDLINIAKTDSSGPGVMDESIAMFLSVELLRTVEALHSRGILHGDLKADNCLLRFEPLPDASWSARYRRDGSDGWDKKGISLIDFGRGIDMRLFRPDVQFIADWKTDAQDCAEMREMRPWTYQIDYHGLAAIIHTMLFGKYIDTVAEKAGLGGRRYKIGSTLKRYWQNEIWTELFDVLLNPGLYVGEEMTGTMPVGRSLRKCREGMETWLEGNCEKGFGLKAHIRRMEMMLGSKRR